MIYTKIGEFEKIWQVKLFKSVGDYVAVSSLFIAKALKCGGLCVGSLFCNVFPGIISRYSIYLLRNIYIQLVG